MNVIVGDCRTELAGVLDGSIDSIVTDPPYELGFMGKKWDASGVAYDPRLWAECFRVLKPGGHLLSFGGARTYHRMAVAIEDAGFEIRDSLHWTYGTGFPKSHNVSKALDKLGADGANQWDGWGTALKPSHEPIVMARKPITQTVAKNVLEHGTGALNIDACRVGSETRVNPPRRTSDGTPPLGGGCTSTESTTATGRWPANTVLTHSPACTDTCTDNCPVNQLDHQSGTSRPKAGRQGKKGGNGGALGAFAGSSADAEGNWPADPGGGASRFFTVTDWDHTIYCAKPSKKERNAGLDGTNVHPTVKPVELMRHLIRLVTPPGGIVLDPFLGSGTTAVAAILEGIDWIGCEITDEYLQIIDARVKWAKDTYRLENR